MSVFCLSHSKAPQKLKMQFLAQMRRQSQLRYLVCILIIYSIGSLRGIKQQLNVFWRLNKQIMLSYQLSYQLILYHTKIKQRLTLTCNSLLPQKKACFKKCCNAALKCRSLAFPQSYSRLVMLRSHQGKQLLGDRDMTEVIRTCAINCDLIAF